MFVLRTSLVVAVQKVVEDASLADGICHADLPHTGAHWHVTAHPELVRSAHEVRQHVLLNCNHKLYKHYSIVVCRISNMNTAALLSGISRMIRVAFSSGISNMITGIDFLDFIRYNLHVKMDNKNIYNKF